MFPCFRLLSPLEARHTITDVKIIEKRTKEDERFIESISISKNNFPLIRLKEQNLLNKLMYI